MFAFCPADAAETTRFCMLGGAVVKHTLPLLFFATCVACVTGVAGGLAGGIGGLRRQSLTLGGLCAVAALVAVLAGYATANARETAIGDVVPLLLAGVGALFAYAVIQQTATRLLSAALAASFAVAFIAGLDAGGVNRDGAAASASAPQVVVLQFDAESLSALRNLSTRQATGTSTQWGLGRIGNGLPMPEQICPQDQFWFVDRCIKVTLPGDDTPTIGPEYHGGDWWQ